MDNLFKSIISSNNYEELINENIDKFTSKDSNGCTIVHYICNNNRVEILQFISSRLHDKIFDLLCRDNKGNTPSHYACSKGHEQIVSYMIDIGIFSFDQLNNMGKTPCHLAVLNKHCHLYSYFFDKLKVGYLNIEDINHANLLHWAVKLDDKKSVEHLLSYDINIYSLTKDGYSTFQLAQNNRNQSILDLLNRKDKYIKRVFQEIDDGPFTPGSYIELPLSHYLDENDHDLLVRALIKGNTTLITYLLDFFVIKLKQHSSKYFTIQELTDEHRSILEDYYNSELIYINMNSLSNEMLIQDLLSTLKIKISTPFPDNIKTLFDLNEYRNFDNHISNRRDLRYFSCLMKYYFFRLQDRQLLQDKFESIKLSQIFEKMKSLGILTCLQFISMPKSDIENLCGNVKGHTRATIGIQQDLANSDFFLRYQFPVDFFEFLVFSNTIEFIAQYDQLTITSLTSVYLNRELFKSGLCQSDYYFMIILIAYTLNRLFDYDYYLIVNNLFQYREHLINDGFDQLTVLPYIKASDLKNYGISDDICIELEKKFQGLSNK